MGLLLVWQWVKEINYATRAFKAALMGTAGVSTADVVLLHDTDYSNTASASISSGISSTYGEYIFKFYNINPANDSPEFLFQVNATDDDGGDYDTSLITSTYFRAKLGEDHSGENLAYTATLDLAQSASFQTIMHGTGNGADESCAGVLHLFNPSSTTYVKHFYSRFVGYGGSDEAITAYAAGYINDTTAIDDIQFKMSAGNFDGTIKMWGVK